MLTPKERGLLEYFKDQRYCGDPYAIEGPAWLELTRFIVRTNRAYARILYSQGGLCQQVKLTRRGIQEVRSRDERISPGPSYWTENPRARYSPSMAHENTAFHTALALGAGLAVALGGYLIAKSSSPNTPPEPPLPNFSNNTPEILRAIGPYGVIVQNA